MKGSTCLSGGKIGIFPPRSQAGFTLIDVSITLFVMTVALVGTMSAFPYIMRAILMAKARSIATIIAQEQLEVYKNTAYYKLHVTTATALDDQYDPALEYDTGYYARETVITGGIEYEKMTYVEKVYENASGDFLHVDWADPDVGMKRIYVHVAYHAQGGSGDWRKVTMSSLLENTDRQQLNATIAGVVRTTDPVSIPNAYVYALENPSFNDTADPTGAYSFNIPAGSWTLITSATGYFVSTSSSPWVASSGTITKAYIYLTKQFLGHVTGYVYIQDHLVITQVVGDYDMPAGPANQEWVELYNPTTYTIHVATKSDAAQDHYDIFFTTVSWIDNSNGEPGTGNSKYLLGSQDDPASLLYAFRSTSTAWDVRFTSHNAIEIPPNRFFLISNYSTVTVQTAAMEVIARMADAYYGGGDGSENRIDTKGGIRVTGAQGHSYNGRDDWHDGFAWGALPGLTLAKEGSCNSKDLETDGIFMRLAYKLNENDCFDLNTSLLRNGNPAWANNFDSNNSGTQCGSSGDFDKNIDLTYHITSSSGIANADTELPPMTGTPAAGAIVTANDGLSAAVFVQRYGSFTLTDVTTGAWTVAIVSSTPRNSYFQEIYTTVTVSPPFLGIPHPFSAPQSNPDPLGLVQNTSSMPFVTDRGMIAGRIVDANGAGIGGIYADAVSGNDQTNSWGYYRLLVSSGSYTVTCNVLNANPSFTQGSSASVIVELGQITDGVDFILISGGNIKGFVTSNGVDPLPGYSISLQRDNAEYTTGITGTDGLFYINNVATATASNPYTALCVADSGESIDPSTGIVVTPVAGKTIHIGTFTVSSGYGTFTGQVRDGSALIETGVLVVGSTLAIVTTSSGPTINSSVTGGATAYYFAASDSAGEYNLRVLGGTLYNLYGWYANESRTVVRVSSVNIPIAIGQSKTVDLQW